MSDVIEMRNIKSFGVYEAAVFIPDDELVSAEACEISAANKKNETLMDLDKVPAVVVTLKDPTITFLTGDEETQKEVLNFITNRIAKCRRKDFKVLK